MEAIEKLLDQMKEAVYITIFYGEDANETEANAVREMIENAATDAEVVLAYGGQPLYDYLISVEA
jgi:dihydroxyacetone kinase-like predicted kinase